ncbi:MAG: hypothetical protein MUP22_09185, partial [Desulfobacterales bacterium]|nr:hypothetical protein [Desulfobacterales bacterium]
LQEHPNIVKFLGSTMINSTINTTFRIPRRTSNSFEASASIVLEIAEMDFNTALVRRHRPENFIPDIS